MGWTTYYPCRFDVDAYNFDVGTFDSISASASDGVKFAEARTVAATHVLTDGVKFADTRSVGVTSVRTDGIKFADAETYKMTASLADGIKLADSHTHVWSAYRTFTDLIVFSEITCGDFPRTAGIWGVSNPWHLCPSTQFASAASAVYGIWTTAATSTNTWTAVSSATNPRWSKVASASTTWS